MEVLDNKLDRLINRLYKEKKSYAEWQRERYAELYKVERDRNDHKEERKA